MREHFTVDAGVDPPTPTDLSAALAEANQVLEQVQSWGQIGFWDVDLTTMTPYWSTQVFAILGLQEPSLRAFRSHVHPDDLELVDHVTARARQQPGPYRAEHRFLRGTETRSLSHQIQSVAGPDGTPHRLMGVVSDVTHVRALQAEVDAAVSIRNLGVLASSLIHSFKNQLAIVLGHSTLALGAVDRDEQPSRESLTAIQRAARQGVELTRQVLDLGRAPTAGVHRVFAGEVLERVAMSARPIVGGANEVIVEVDRGSRPVLADSDRLEQVLIDFVINSADALADSGGHVRLSYRETHVGEVAHDGVSPGSYGVFSVVDDGAGMDEETRLRSTQPFFSTKVRGRGTGIGLTTASAFAQELGGRLVIRSEVGRGTVVELLLPLAPEAASVRGGPPVRVVLVSTDDLGSRRAVQQLAEAGIQAVVARDRPELDRFLQTEPIDAVAIDRGTSAVEVLGGVPVIEASLSDPSVADLIRAVAGVVPRIEHRG